MRNEGFPIALTQGRWITLSFPRHRLLRCACLPRVVVALLGRSGWLASLSLGYSSGWVCIQGCSRRSLCGTVFLAASAGKECVSPVCRYALPSPSRVAPVMQA